MLSPIIRKLIDDFNKTEEVSFDDVSINFEAFCNFSIISNEYKGDFNIDDVSMAQTQGVDGLAIIVNGSLVTTTEEIDDLVGQNNYIETTFIFIQAKTTTSFDGTDISNFFVSVEDFFNESPKQVLNDEIKKALQLKNKISKYVSKETRGKPVCKLYYVTTGRWENDQSLVGRIENHKGNLLSLGQFGKIDFKPCGASEIQDLYLHTKRLTTCEFNFENHVVLPSVQNVQEAYSGIVKFDEFLKIITNEDGELKDVFYENVRDFLGESNNVNEEIESTLKSKDFDLFCLLNNGITMVASIKTNKGNTFYIENYQIVNGCQTSHILFKNKSREGINAIYIPLKLVITNDDSVQNKVIIATNNQTSIPKEQLEAFSKFQKELELFYESEGEPKARLFYERRQRQYRDKEVSRPRIVTIREQIKTFAAMFLQQPHLASGYFSKVYTTNKEKMFIEGDKYNSYYISSFSMYRLNSLLNAKVLAKKYRVAKYHLIMIFLMLIDKDIPRMNSRGMETYCNKVKKVLLDDKETIRYFKNSINILNSVNTINLEEQETLYLAENTQLIIEKLGDQSKN